MIPVIGVCHHLFGNVLTSYHLSYWAESTPTPLFAYLQRFSFLFFFPKEQRNDKFACRRWQFVCADSCSAIEQEHRSSRFGSLFSENCWKAAIYPWPGISDQRLPALETLNCWYCWQKSYSYFLVRLCHINWRLFSSCQRTLTSSHIRWRKNSDTTEPMLIVGLTPCFS